MEEATTERSHIVRLKKKITALETEIAGLKAKLDAAETILDDETQHTKPFDFYDRKVTAIRQQLDNVYKQLERAENKELLLVQANSAAEQLSQAGTSLFVLILSVTPHGIHVLYGFCCVHLVFCCLYRAFMCSNSVLVLVRCSV
jgi:predicted RNase H-like nuclease (RuvC/YqgF family)